MTKKEEALAKRKAKLEAEKQRIDSMKEYERRHNDCALICGFDEAGRGPFAGPVVAGAVILDWRDPSRDILYLNDSKKLSEKKRETIYKEILKNAVAAGVGIVGAKIIDQINILQATYLAMHRALHNLRRPYEYLNISSGEPTGEGNINVISIEEKSKESFKDSISLLIDNMEISALAEKLAMAEPPADDCRLVPDYILADAVHIPELIIPQEGIVKGDAKSVSIAAASIIAKVTRDHIMYKYDELHPEYGFASNKGYGTRAHIQAIKEHGMLDIHRRSFIHF